MKHLFCTLLALSVLAFSGCRKDCDDPTNPDCANYDPCTGYVGADAGFKILRIPIPTLGWNCGGEEPRDLEFETDSIFGSGSVVYFRANQEDANRYEWKVGADSRTWATRKFDLGFGQNAVGQVPIRLIVEKDNPLSCGGVAVTRDTLTKVLHVIPPPAEPFTKDWSPIYGKWLGHNEEQPDRSFEIEIIPNFPFPVVNNLLQDCVDREMQVGIGRTFMYIDGRGQLPCKRMCGIGLLGTDHKTLVIDYTYQEGEGDERTSYSRKFIGAKVE